MGCYQGKLIWEESEENIAKSLRKLGYTRKPYNLVVKTFHCHFPFIYLSRMELIEALKSLRLSYIEDFYRFFLVSKSEIRDLSEKQGIVNYNTQTLNTKTIYSVKKLSTLAILLCKGNYEDKAKCLFLIYKIDDSMILNE
jgi:hypothetical protein